MTTLTLNGQNHQLDVTGDNLPVRYQLQGWRKAEA
jgi:hypothetical protein